MLRDYSEIVIYQWVWNLLDTSRGRLPSVCKTRLQKSQENLMSDENRRTSLSTVISFFSFLVEKDFGRRGVG